jgi:triosephosphate isomerase
MSPARRKPLVCANWKMNQTAREAEAWAAAFTAAIEPQRSALEGACEIAVAPAHPVLDRLGQALAGTGVALAAQNVHADESGAFTGEVSLAMLEDLGCRYALIGHSERRQLFGERDAGIAAKAARLQGSSVRPILCVGETLDEREHDRTLDVVRSQLGAVLDRASGLGDELVVAYEPVWAIGTGKTATPELAQAVHAALRETLVERLGETGTRIRLLYGGSVKPSNAIELLSQPEIDGALVGGASLDPGDFADIVLASLSDTP